MPIDASAASFASNTYDLGSESFQWRVSYNNINQYVAQSTPSSNPSTTTAYKMYFKSDGNLYKLNSTGTETQLNSSTNVLTTKGDLVGYGTGTSRLGVGANGQVLTADSSATLGISWKTPTGISAESVTTVAAAYSITANDGVIFADSSSGGYTITPPNAATYPGKILTFFKTTTDTNTITISGIVGSTTTTLNYQNDSESIVSNGSAWQQRNKFSQPSYELRAWAVIDQSASADISGTYAQSTTQITITITNHGVKVGQVVYMDFTSGTAVDAAATVVTVIDANTFTVNSGSATTSGNVTLRRHAFQGKNIDFVSDAGVGISIVNFIRPMQTTNYAVTATRRAYSAANGTAVAENSYTRAQTVWAYQVESVIVSSAVNRTLEDSVIHTMVVGA